MADTWLITGTPGAGKTTLARLLAERLERAVVIEGDLRQGWIVSGNVWPGQEPAAESARQIHLNMRNQCLLAQSYAAASFTPIIDYVIISQADLREPQAMERRICHVSKHQDPPQFQTVCHGRRNPSILTAVRPEAQRLHEAVQG